MSAETSFLTPLREQPLKQLNRIAKRPPIDIEFQDLTYSVPDSSCKSGWRQLLKSVNGVFRSGELTAIMGPSGAGKSTLLNILAGYVTAGVKGSIRINNRPREMKLFNKLSSYIMQEDLIQPRLSVRESMTIAASLKLSSSIKKEEKIAVIDEVINLLGLETCYDTRSEHLSGGQRRRLSVALELVNNPPVIFLDEPTTGLDNVAIKQCIELLQKITRLDRTVICTIHQPPASLFQNFDQVYVMANGYCVYNGSPNRLVQFMSGAGCLCPPTSTPADFSEHSLLIELVQTNPENINVLQTYAQNGKCNMKDKRVKTAQYVTDSLNLNEIYQVTTQSGSTPQDIIFPTSFWTQFCILVCRMLLQMKRNQTMLNIQFFHHLISGLLIVPLEVKLLRREYFNRWYSLKAYYVALNVAALPLLLVNVLMFAVIVYTLVDLPWEPERFMWFCLLGIAISLCSQGLGYAIGAAFNILNGSVVAPHILALILALAVYGMGYKGGIEPLMKALMSTSYLRFGLVGLSGVLFNDRKPMDCNQIYCHYRNPDLIIRDMGMTDAKPPNQFIVVMGFMFFFRLISYLSLKYSMTSELRNTIVHYAAKIVRQKET
ncbi:hypothetical protein NQ315_007889 [Exocentrus adspersus]|uniref:ABC transporter domain-containing protein n=1 Tax=Exocentrus adspersus TaxID=1586481 RepID=A0AAV8W8K6_9CUCU|nr:hypothetical protein NQ315_007889 [Exocentrus adspersus]